MASTSRATTARIKQITAEIRALETVVSEARKAGSFGPAINGLKAIGLLNADVARLRAAAAINAETDPLKRIQMQRHLALAKGAHVPAQHLVQVEAGLVAGLAQADAMRAQAELTGLSADDLVDIILGAVAAMPTVDVERIALACANHGQRRPTFEPEDDE